MTLHDVTADGVILTELTTDKLWIVTGRDGNAIYLTQE